MSLDFALEDDFPFSAPDDPEPEAEFDVVVDEDSFAAVGEVWCCVCPLVEAAPPPPPPAELERW